MYEHLVAGGICMNRSGKLSRMPNKPATIIRGVRVPDELWADSKFIAKVSGYSGISEAVREDLEARREQYIATHGPIDRNSTAYKDANRAH